MLTAVSTIILFIFGVVCWPTSQLPASLAYSSALRLPALPNVPDLMAGGGYFKRPNYKRILSLVLEGIRIMAHDAFISYSAKDSLAADSICAALEAEGVKCWMAPRDILPSEKYSQSIIKAIGESHLMILVFSSSANESDHVISEVDRAYNKRKPIIPVRIQDVPLSPALEYYLSTAQWQDALPPPIQQLSQS